MTRARRITLAALVLLAACSRGREPAGGAAPERGLCACDGPQPVVDPALLAALSRARALHHEADLAENERDTPKAIAALERIEQGVGSAPRRPEMLEVLADTRARLAELRASLGKLDEAASDVQKGLGYASGPSYFRGHLFEVLGEIEEKRGASLDKAGDVGAAADARRRGLDASEQAVHIQDEVIKKTMEPARP